MISHELTQPVFRALADPTRRAILDLLAEEPQSIGTIANQFYVTRPAVAKHLKVLEEGGLIVVRQQGRERINYLHASALKNAVNWMSHFEQFWDEKLMKLKQAVEEESHD